MQAGYGLSTVWLWAGSAGVRGGRECVTWPEVRLLSSAYSLTHGRSHNVRWGMSIQRAKDVAVWLDHNGGQGSKCNNTRDLTIKLKKQDDST